jgi:hypothetical protein
VTESAEELSLEQMEKTLKRAVGGLVDAGIDFMLAGSLASWARGGPDTRHDLDMVVRPADADAALEALEAIGLRGERPPERWLYKAWDGDTLVDLIFEPAGLDVEDGAFGRAGEVTVFGIPVLALSLEDLLITKLMAMGPKSIDYEPTVQIARALREQIDFEDVRRRTATSPYARAFFSLIAELGVIPAPPAPEGGAGRAPQSHGGVSIRAIGSA